MAAAIAIGIVLGYLLERLIIVPVYGNHTQQILITLGAMLVLSELVKVFWGPNQIVAQPPEYLKGSWGIGDFVLIKYRLFIILIGFIVLIALLLLLNKTKIGLIVRAGVMNKEMVQALGINIRKVFLFVFVLGASMAGFPASSLGRIRGSFIRESVWSTEFWRLLWSSSEEWEVCLVRYWPRCLLDLPVHLQLIMHPRFLSVSIC